MLQWKRRQWAMLFTFSKIPTKSPSTLVSNRSPACHTILGWCLTNCTYSKTGYQISCTLFQKQYTRVFKEARKCNGEETAYGLFNFQIAISCWFFEFFLLWSPLAPRGDHIVSEINSSGNAEYWSTHSGSTEIWEWGQHTELWDFTKVGIPSSKIWDTEGIANARGPFWAPIGWRLVQRFSYIW